MTVRKLVKELKKHNRKLEVEIEYPDSILCYEIKKVFYEGWWEGYSKAEHIVINTGKL